jgi:hypothetical protein
MDHLERALLATAALAATVVAWNDTAQAATLKFVMQGTDNYTWTMDSDPTPVNPDIGGAWGFAGAPGAPGDGLNFFNIAENGGMNAVQTVGGVTTEIFDYNGPQLYTGSESAPHFDTGLFTFVGNVLTHGPASETLQISLAPTPIPATLPLLISALGGLGFFGWRRSKASAAG